MAKGFLDPRTRDKIKVKGSDYLPTLLELIDEETLPTFLGGKCDKPFPSDVGPWNDYECVNNIFRKKGEGDSAQEEEKKEEAKVEELEGGPV